MSKLGGNYKKIGKKSQHLCNKQIYPNTKNWSWIFKATPWHQTWPLPNSASFQRLLQEDQESFQESVSQSEEGVQSGQMCWQKIPSSTLS